MTALQTFFDEYRTTFTRFDRDALAEVFTFPLQLVSVSDDEVAVSTSDREGWLGVLDGLLGAYRALGVASADRLEFSAIELSPKAASARVHWELRREDGSTVYDFTAIYTVVEAQGALRVAAVTHDELPKLMAALSG